MLTGTGRYVVHQLVGAHQTPTVQAVCKKVTGMLTYLSPGAYKELHILEVSVGPGKPSHIKHAQNGVMPRLQLGQSLLHYHGSQLLTFFQ